MKAHRLASTGAILRFHDLPGPGTPLVFLHGLGCASSCDFPRVAADPALLDRRRILVDLLGSGFSDRPARFSYAMEDHARSVLELLDALGTEEVDLFGHSMGGAVAIAAATQGKGRIRRLVVAEPNLDPGGGIFSRAIAAQGEADYVASGHERILLAARAEGSLVWAGSMAASSPLAVHREAVALVRGGDPSWRESLLRFPGFRTALFGARSLPDPHFRALGEAGLEVRVVPEAGHSMMWDNPSGLAEAIRAATR